MFGLLAMESWRYCLARLVLWNEHLSLLLEYVSLWLGHCHE
jgi:hypothetical protein